MEKRQKCGNSRKTYIVSSFINFEVDIFHSIWHVVGHFFDLFYFIGLKSDEIICNLLLNENGHYVNAYFLGLSLATLKKKNIL